MRKTRVIIVDDSSFMRIALKKMITQYDDIEVVDFACNGQEAIEKIKEHRPDVITLDIEMPIMDGLTALKIIMKETPTRVIMVSSLTNKGALVTMEALDLGAVDFIPKPGSYVAVNIIDIKDELVTKIRDSLSIPLRNLVQRYNNFVEPPSQKPETKLKISELKDKVKTVPQQKLKYKVVAVATSTGGPPALNKLITALPENFPVPMLVVQHMPPGFTKPMADRLNNISKVTVKEAEHGDILQPGYVYIGKAGTQFGFRKLGTQVSIKLLPPTDEELFNPCGDVLFSGIADMFGGDSVGVIMTGMGKDGVIGLKKMKELGSYLIAESEETAVVYGMPRVAVEAGIIDKIVKLPQIPYEVVKLFT
jgi:two-component system, chemotaxis family, protein-glutamate methylesterase/glutaminase